jgi:pimeloyl-ACP methyl ester carboxylesterase
MMSRPNETYLGGHVIYREFGGRPGYLIEPVNQPDPQRQWIWIIPSWLAFPSHDSTIQNRSYVKEALARGFWVAGIDPGLAHGSPKGVAVFQRFYETLIAEYGMFPKARLCFTSAGGIMTYNWASRHPASVDRMLGICPVVDVRTWPPRGLIEFCGPDGFDMTPEELAARLGEFNPIELLPPLAAHRVKILHLHGDHDTAVPLEPNSAELARRYRALGGPIELEVFEGEGHKVLESEKAFSFLFGG